jgi:hypothetical protein
VIVVTLIAKTTSIPPLPIGWCRGQSGRSAPCFKSTKTAACYLERVVQFDGKNRSAVQRPLHLFMNTASSQIRRTIDMHFRVYDLSAERCVWSIPPIDTVPVKLRGEKLLVRSVDNEGGVFEVTSVNGEKLEEIAPQQLADRRVARLSLHLATDDSYAGHVVRFDKP